MIKRNERVKSIFAKSNETKEKIKVNREIKRFAEEMNRRFEVKERVFLCDIDASQITGRTISDTAILSAIIPDNKKPEIKQKETSEQEEDRKHKTYFWLGLCVLVFLYAGFTKW